MCTFAAYYLQRGVINAAQCQDHRSAPLSYCTHLEEILSVMMKCISHDLPRPQARSRECQADTSHALHAESRSLTANANPRLGWREADRAPRG